MIRIGAVNIDTSHPLGFGEVMEKDDRARYVGVYNDSFRPDSEVEGFIRRFGLEKRCNTLEELAAMCDIGFIHGCDWDDHLRCAMPFIEQGKPVFIDKPPAIQICIYSACQTGCIFSKVQKRVNPHARSSSWRCLKRSAARW